MTAASAARGGFNKATPISVATTAVTPDVKLRMAFLSMMFPLSTIIVEGARRFALAPRIGSFDLETIADLTMLKVELRLVQGRHSLATGGMLDHHLCSSRLPQSTSTMPRTAE